MRKINNHKKGQITIFLIVGIVLLFSSALIFYIRGQSVEGIPSEYIDEITQVPNEARPIQQFVEQCLYETGKEGIKQIGLHGGYPDIYDSQYTPTVSFDRAVFPTESSSVVFSGYPAFNTPKTQDVPYWFHMKSANTCVNNCEFSELGMPKLTKLETPQGSIESNIAIFVQRNIDNCLNSFVALRDVGFNFIDKSEPLVDATIRKDDVLLRLTYPLTFEKGSEIKLSEFASRVDVKLKEVYELANAVQVAQKNSRFLELAAMDMIVAQTEYSPEITGTKLPPIGEITFDTSQYAIWLTQVVKNQIEDNVLPFVNRLKFEKSQNFYQYRIYDPSAFDTNQMQLVADKFTVSLLHLDNQTVFPHVSVDLTYLDWWPIYLDLNGNSIIKPDKTVIPFFPYVGFIRYQTFYDVSFPVLVRLSEDSAFKGEGFDFYYFLEGNIRNNKPFLQGNSDVPVIKHAPQLACRTGNYGAGPINISLIDALTGEAVEDAIVNFNFGSDSCYLGLYDNQKTSFTLPTGLGTLQIIKEGYIEVTKPYLAIQDLSEDLEIEMMPEIILTGHIHAVPLTYVEKGQYSIGTSGALRTADPADKASVFLKRIPDDQYGEYQSFLSIDKENAISGFDSFRLIPGTYEIDGMLISEKENHLVKGGKITGGDNGTIDDIYMNNTYHGGVSFKNETQLVTFTKEDLKDAKSIIFKVLDYPLPEVILKDFGDSPDIMEVTNITGATKVHANILMPEVIK